MKPLKQNETSAFRWLLIPLLLVGIISISWTMLLERHIKPKLNNAAAATQEPKKVDEQAKKILTEMSDYLTGLQQFSYKSTGYMELILKSTPEKKKVFYVNEVFVKRPNKLRANTKGEKADAEFYYDGVNFSVYGKIRNLYAQHPAPPALDQALDVARDELNLDPAGADLLYLKPAEGLLQNIETGKYVGEAIIEGTPCHHLAFSGPEVDWVIYIEKGKKPVPRKYEITNKLSAEKPVAAVDFSNWRTEENLNDRFFSFQPPKNAKKIEFLKNSNLATLKAPTK